ncbi:hypothetical protein ACJIZ3_019552 [Penstemon smallii]|uniref:Dynein light chain n=1 Tax=Penstemon smallii TaxID=265156 RepID=A0ABD3T1J2_9LAMI
MEAAEEELERRSKFLNSLILQKKKINNNNSDQKQLLHGGGSSFNVRVRASDMPLPLQDHAFATARSILADSSTISPSSSNKKLDTKHLALALKKDFDSTYGPAWHCIVGTSFGSYVTYSLGGFLYFSIDKIYILLFKTAVQPMDQR